MPNYTDKSKNLTESISSTKHLDWIGLAHDAFEELFLKIYWP